MPAARCKQTWPTKRCTNMEESHQDGTPTITRQYQKVINTIKGETP